MLDNDPTAIPLTRSDRGSLVFPRENFGDGVFVRPDRGRWRLVAGTDEWNPMAARNERLRQKRGSTRRPRPPDVVLDEIVLVHHEARDGRFNVAGYWNLVGDWRPRARGSDWPFGGKYVGWEKLGDVPIAVCLSNTSDVFVPTVPSFDEMQRWILDRQLEVPPWKCNCGAVHHGAGPVVGLAVEQFGEKTPFVLRSVNLIARDEAHGGYRGASPHGVLPLVVCTLLDAVELGGHGAGWWNKHGSKAK